MSGSAPFPPPVIAIDGPAGAGKSTAARNLARRLGFLLLDTGAIYRSLALAARRRGIAWSDEPGLARLAAELRLAFEPEDQRVSEEKAGEGGSPPGDGQRVLLDGEDVSEIIRTPEMSDGSSQVSSLASVRAALLELQREIARRGRYVVEGRDIGSVVLPWAPLKFFMTASPEVRAQRRHDELVARGLQSDLEATFAGILARDHRDETRAAAPLKQADDALLVDSSTLSLDEVVDRMERIARDKLGDLISLDASDRRG